VQYRKTLTYRNSFQYRVKGIGPPGFDSSVFGVASLSRTAQMIGWDSASFGTPTVFNLTSYLFPGGFATQSFGTPALINYDTFVTVPGFSTDVYGTPTVYNYLQIVRPTGFDSSVFSGTTWVSNWIRYLQPSGFFTEAQGSHLVADGIRYVDLVSQGPQTDVYGTTIVQLKIRNVYPQWFVPMVFGTPMMGYTLTASPSGWQQDEWGTAFVHDNKQYIDQAGNMQGAVGQPSIDQRNRQVWPVTITEDDIYRFGFLSVRNTRQIITANYVETQWNDPNGVVSGDLHIYNKNRELDLIHNGIAPLFQQIPITHEIRNNAQAAAPDGFESLQFGQQLVAYRIRNVAPPGWLSYIDGEYRVVYNAALAVYPGGWDSAVLGVPENVVNTRRYFAYWGIGETLEIGTAFIAPRIRTLAPNGMDLGRVADQTATNVWFRVREIAPAGWQYTPMGTLAFDINFNIVRPNQIPPIEAYGLPVVRNVTPQLFPYWDEALWTAWGQTAIYNKNNYYALNGFATQAFGLVYVADRTQHIIVPPTSSLIFQNLTQVRNEIPDPPATQKVFPSGITLGVTDPALFGALTMTANSLYPVGWVNDVYGQTLVYVNGIFPQGITPPWSGVDHSEMGHPTVNPTQYITFAGSNQPPTDDPLAPTQLDLFMFGSGKPRMSPYTIYAPQGGTQQYKDNNPPGLDMPMDGDLFGPVSQSSMPVWGSATVTLKNRVIYQYDTQGADGYLRWGNPTVSTNPQYVDVVGLKSFKYGIPKVNNANELDVAGWDDLQFDGAPTVALVPEQNRTLPVTGFNANVFGLTWVANFIRYLPPAGIDSAQFGTAHPQPPPPPAQPKGWDTSVFGTAMVAYRIRNVYPEGTDTFTCDYTLGSFADRMRVIGMGDLHLDGIDSAAFGVPMVDQYHRTVQVQGIPVGPIAVSVPTVRQVNIVALAGFGFDSTEFGDVQRWEAGKIKPQGQDMLDTGTAALARTVPLASLGDMAGFGDAHAVLGIGVEGMDAAEYGAQVAMGFGCGRQARAMTGWDSLLVGDHGIVFAPPSGQNRPVGWESLAVGAHTARGQNRVLPLGSLFGQFGNVNVDRRI